MTDTDFEDMTLDELLAARDELNAELADVEAAIAELAADDCTDEDEEDED